jgi:hypothetical protein
VVSTTPTSCARVQRRQRGFFCWLDDAGAASSKRRRNLARNHGTWKIPRRDRRDNPYRLFQYKEFAARDRRLDDVAVNAAGFLGKPLDKRCRVGDLGFGLRKGFSLLAGKEPGELSACDVIRSNHRRNRRARSLPGRFFHPAKAVCAARIAASASCGVQSAMLARTLPLAGSVTSKRFSSDASTHWLPIKA